MHILMSIAILASIFYGAADFLGGLASTRAPTYSVVIVSQAAGVLLLAIALPLLPAATIVPADLLWGAAAGCAGGIGVALLYRGLASGPMSVVAPVTAVCAVVVPVVVGLSLGERPSGVTLAGIGLAVVAVALAGQSVHADEPAHADPQRRWRALRLAVSSGVMIGLFLVALGRTPASAGLWPLVAARVVSISLFSAIAIGAGDPIVLTGQPAMVAIIGGTLDMVANFCYLAAVRHGPLSVIATLASLYPATTVLLARLFLRERLTRTRIVGIAAALAAIVIIVGSSSR
jgi:drug/metabolite transporter (DMT)-like permease